MGSLIRLHHLRASFGSSVAECTLPKDTKNLKSLTPEQMVLASSWRQRSEHSEPSTQSTVSRTTSADHSALQPVTAISSRPSGADHTLRAVRFGDTEAFLSRISRRNRIVLTLQPGDSLESLFEKIKPNSGDEFFLGLNPITRQFDVVISPSGASIPQYCKIKLVAGNGKNFEVYFWNDLSIDADWIDLNPENWFEDVDAADAAFSLSVSLTSDRVYYTGEAHPGVLYYLNKIKETYLDFEKSGFKAAFSELMLMAYRKGGEIDTLSHLATDKPESLNEFMHRLDTIGVHDYLLISWNDGSFTARPNGNLNDYRDYNPLIVKKLKSGAIVIEVASERKGSLYRINRADIGRNPKIIEAIKRHMLIQRGHEEIPDEQVRDYVDLLADIVQASEEKAQRVRNLQLVKSEVSQLDTSGADGFGKVIDHLCTIVLQEPLFNDGSPECQFMLSAHRLFQNRYLPILNMARRDPEFYDKYGDVGDICLARALVHLYTCEIIDRLYPALCIVLYSPDLKKMCLQDRLAYMAGILNAQEVKPYQPDPKKWAELMEVIDTMSRRDPDDTEDFEFFVDQIFGSSVSSVMLKSGFYEPIYGLPSRMPEFIS